MNDGGARAHVWISGLVQGVNFRWRCSDRAKRRSVAGWVRNLPDGRVEAVFEGPPDEVDAMVTWCREGPRSARVDLVEVEWEQAEGLSDFTVRFRSGPGA